MAQDKSFSGFNDGGQIQPNDVVVGLRNEVNTRFNYVDPGAVTLPVNDGNFANFDGTLGVLKDDGFLPTDSSKTRVVMADAAVVVDHIATYTDANGTISDDASTAINAGNLQAGLSGTAGTLTSFPGTAARGSLIVSAVDNTGDTITTISNAAMGQATVMSIPDPGQTTSEFIIADSAATQNITSGNLTVDVGNITASAGNVVATAGDVISGSDANAGIFQSFPTTTTTGSLKIAAVDSAGAFDVTISNASHAQSTVVSIPDGGQATTEFILADSAGTQTITSGNLDIAAGTLDVSNAITSLGNITAGASGDKGTFRAFPVTASSGKIILDSINNSGDFDVTIRNASHAQSTVVSIPDSGQATTNFILADFGGTQTINTGNFTVSAGNISATIGDIIAVDGNVIAGNNGNVGQLFCYPPTASAGTMRLQCLDNSGDFAIIIKNASHAQSTTYSIPDVGQSTGSFIVSDLTPFAIYRPAFFNSALVTQAQLAGGATRVLFSSGGSTQYIILELRLAGTSINFSGGGGDRDLDITDGTTVYTTIPAAILQAQVLGTWGDATVPFPTGGSMVVATAAGANINAVYSGGTTDYTAGQLILSVRVLQEA